MPEFILNEPPRPRERRAASAAGYAKSSPSHPYWTLDSFARGYVEAMFFTNGDTGDERENLLNDWGVERLTKASVAAIARDCTAFEEAAGALLDLAYERDDYSPEQAGRDFWFTRQGHGVGFWDRKQLAVGVYRETEPEGRPFEVGDDSAAHWAGAQPAGELGDLLSIEARKFGESYVEAYRGWIHIR
jgi:hypothetical protein